MNVMAKQTESELLEVADQLREELVERSNEIDKNRYLPQDLADKLASIGFYRLVAPETLGGLGVSPEFFCRICESLAKGNGSTAWSSCLRLR